MLKKLFLEFVLTKKLLLNYFRLKKLLLLKNLSFLSYIYFNSEKFICFLYCLMCL